MSDWSTVKHIYCILAWQLRALQLIMQTAHFITLMAMSVREERERMEEREEGEREGGEGGDCSFRLTL